MKLLRRKRRALTCTRMPGGWGGSGGWERKWRRGGGLGSLHAHPLLVSPPAKACLVKGHRDTLPLIFPSYIQCYNILLLLLPHQAVGLLKSVLKNMLIIPYQSRFIQCYIITRALMNWRNNKNVILWRHTALIKNGQNLISQKTLLPWQHIKKGI